MEKRRYGRTDVWLSVVGFGGIVVRNETPKDAARIVGMAVDKGINYFDVAPSYGNAEERLGPALKPYRDGVFLACKTGKRDAAGSEEELHRSLDRLKTDHFDLYQCHGVSSLADVDAIFGDGGAIRTLIKAKEEGLTRFLGFSAHSEEAALAMMDRFSFDSVLFPVNWASWLGRGFGEKIMAKAQEKGVARLAIKALAKRRYFEGEERRFSKEWYSPVDTYEEASLGLRFTLEKPVTAAVSPGHEELLWWACDAAENLSPLTDEERRALEEKSKGLTPVFPAV